jgi:putative flippase GtrA
MRALLGQGSRFAIAGATVAVVYILTTLFLHHVAGLGFQLALVLGLLIGTTTHFLLQRNFVWRHEDPFALSLRHQVGRYVVIASIQYGLTTLSTRLLPPALGVQTDIVYVATVVCLAAMTFLLLRARVFHATGSAT